MAPIISLLTAAHHIIQKDQVKPWPFPNIHVLIIDIIFGQKDISSVIHDPAYSSFFLRVSVLFDDLGGGVCCLAAVADSNITKPTRFTSSVLQLSKSLASYQLK